MNVQKKRKTERWLLPLFLLSLLLFGFSCNDNDSECTVNEEIADLNCPVPPICGKEGDIVGKWKLVKAKTARIIEPAEIIDYSCEDIIYEFRADKKLVMSSSVDGILEGEHEYWFLPPPYDALISNNGYVDDIPFNFNVSKSIMKMGAALFVETPTPEHPYQKYGYTLVRIGE